MRTLIAIVLALAIVTSSCTNDNGARKALEAQGFSNIQLTGWAAAMCGEDDTCTGFVATGPTGRRVEGAVGCGYWFKGCTIRIK